MTLAAIYYVEPFTTYDADIIFVAAEKGLTAGLPALYSHLQERGWRVEREHLLIRGFPVQFLAAAGLTEEAVRAARTIAYEGVPAKVFRPEHIIAIEQEIIAPIHNSQGEYLETPLVAIADLITEGNEELTVREFKTSGRAYSEMEAETSLQPTCYINAAQETYGHAATVEYTVLVKTKTPKVQRLTTGRTHLNVLDT